MEETKDSADDVVVGSLRGPSPSLSSGHRIFRGHPSSYLNEEEYLYADSV